MLLMSCFCEVDLGNVNVPLDSEMDRLIASEIGDFAARVRDHECVRIALTRAARDLAYALMMRPDEIVRYVQYLTPPKTDLFLEWEQVTEPLARGGALFLRGTHSNLAEVMHIRLASTDVAHERVMLIVPPMWVLFDTSPATHPPLFEKLAHHDRQLPRTPEWSLPTIAHLKTEQAAAVAAYQEHVRDILGRELTSEEAADVAAACARYYYMSSPLLTHATRSGAIAHSEITTSFSEMVDMESDGADLALFALALINRRDLVLRDVRSPIPHCIADVPSVPGGKAGLN